MIPLVKVSLSFLRIAVQASLFIEAQRLLLRLVRPTHRNRLAQSESYVLRRVRSRIIHRWIPDGRGNLIHVLETPGPSTTTSSVAAQRPPIILLHGHSMSAAFWARNFDDLVSLGYRVYAVDLLGWGRSQRPKFRGRTADDSLEWYLPSLRGVVSRLGLARFTLVGHSLGAYLALEYTKRAQQQVERLVLVAPAASARRMPVSRAMYFSLPPQAIVRRGGLLGFLLFFLKYPRRETYVSDRLREYTYHLAAQMPASGEAAVRPIIRVHGPRHAECVRPLIEHLSLFTTPVQIVVGETDSSMPVEGVHDLYREMRRQGFKVDIKVVEGADHCPQLEQPEEFFNIIAGLGKPGKGSDGMDEFRIRAEVGSVVPEIGE